MEQLSRGSLSNIIWQSKINERIKNIERSREYNYKEENYEFKIHRVMPFIWPRSIPVQLDYHLFVDIKKTRKDGQIELLKKVNLGSCLSISIIESLLRDKENPEIRYFNDTLKDISKIEKEEYLNLEEINKLYLYLEFCKD